jgi:GT2 family glycosyltransferase
LPSAETVRGGQRRRQEQGFRLLTGAFVSSLHSPEHIARAPLTGTVPAAVVIPTYSRGLAVLSVLEKIQACDPRPIEIWVHVDCAEGLLESELNRRFPSVGVLTSAVRLGPGGGRHRCLLACSAPYAVSFDDDSYPVDTDFFRRVEQLFLAHPNAAIFAANIWYRNEAEKARVESLNRSPSYVGCGFAIRVAAYNKIRGLLPRPVAYGMEETDLSMQLFAAGWHIYEAGDLRVFHDADLKHHQSSEINAGTITNAGLFVFLHFPLIRWGSGLLQVGNRVVYSIRMARFRGICSGLLQIPIECYRNRRCRNAIAWPTLRRFLAFRRTGCLP